MRLFASWHRSALFPAALSGAAHFPERHGEGRRSALDRHRQPQRGPHPRHRDHRTFFCANMRRVNEALRKAGFRMRKTWYTAAMSGDTKIVGLWRDKHKTGEAAALPRSEEHTSELQSLMRISYAVFCLKTIKHTKTSKQHVL